MQVSCWLTSNRVRVIAQMVSWLNVHLTFTLDIKAFAGVCLEGLLWCGMLVV
jgi:hypothetical protein